MKKIKSIEIKNSTFFNDCKIEFSEGLSCIMGGRGSGKTTLLYFIKSAIESNSEDIDTIHKILRSNLGNGEINLEIETEDCQTYIITKTVNEIPQSYIFPSQTYISIEKIEDEIECDIYEAGKIEQIGRSSKDRLDLIDKKARGEIIEHENSINKLKIDLDANAQDIKTFNRKIKQIGELLLQYQNIEDDFEYHKQQQPAGIKDEEKQEFETADQREKMRGNEKRFLNKTIDLFKGIKNELELKKLQLSEYGVSVNDSKDGFDNKTQMNDAVNITLSTIDAVNAHLSSIQQKINDAQTGLDSVFSKLIETHDLQQAEFVRLKQKFDQNKEYINKYHNLSKRLDEKKNLINDQEELSKKHLVLKEYRKSLVERLNNLKQELFNVRVKIVKELNESFDNDIVVTLTFGGITDEFQEKLRNGLRGSGMRYNELIPRIAGSFSTDKFASIVHTSDIESLKNITGIDEARASALIDTLFESDTIYEIESLYCTDLPEFKLRIAEDSLNMEENYRKTDELSMGQRCTTVLPIIFAVSNNPLIIDQPEDNLDNKYITNRIHEIIKKQKQNRQLIFITHNPNIPVLSEAEQNIFLLYENRKSKIDGNGTVDEVKDKIVNLLEGGEEAFKKRIEIYGF